LFAIRPLLKQVDLANDVAQEALDAGDLVTFCAAIQLAAQLLQLARIWERMNR
jgi:hypothetical protein